jgi:hypothetical protein
MQKGSNKAFHSSGSRGSIANYFSDCQAVTKLLSEPNPYYSPDLIKIVQCYNSNCSEPNNDPKDYDLPDFHQSASRFTGTFSASHNFIVLDPLDQRSLFYNEKFSDDRNFKLFPYKYSWSLPVPDIVKNRLEDDLKKSNAIDSNGHKLFIKPTIEVFFGFNSGFIFNRSHSKIRIRLAVYDEQQHELFSKVYETFYASSGTDKEYEGHFITTESEPPNIVMGICLRKTLDKFYEDLLNVP